MQILRPPIATRIASIETEFGSPRQKVQQLARSLNIPERMSLDHKIITLDQRE